MLENRKSKIENGTQTTRLPCCLSAVKERVMIRYCRHCVMPETKPDLFIDDQGICNACHNYARRQEIDWEARKEQLLQILKRYRAHNGSNYDCLIPVSGGKDSTFQTVRMLELGMNPLCVT